MARIFLLAICLLLTAPRAFADEVADCSRAEPASGRVLCLEAELAAPVAEVWGLWASSEQLQTWLAPVAAIDLRPGGMMESAYDPAGRIGAEGNILNRVVAVSPMQSLSIQVARAPPGFPHPEEVRELVTLIELLPAGERSTRVRVSMTGFQAGAAYDELYAFFARGNAWTLQKLRERVVDGPVDWRAAAAE